MVGDGDVAAIFSNGDFDTDAVFTITPANPPTAAVTLTVPGWFTGASEQVNILTNQVEAVLPMFDCETSAIATVKNRMSAVINSTTYTVERIQNLGTGISTVHLKT